MKFIHVSNVNLGASYESDSLLPVDRKRDYEEDFIKMLLRAQDEKVDCVFITGGLFSHVPEKTELEKLDEVFKKLSMQIFWISGKKEDQSISEEISNFTFSKNVHYSMGKQVERVYLSQSNVEVTFLGYDEESFSKLKMKGLNAGKKGQVEILLLPELKEDMPQGYDYIGIESEVPVMKVNDHPIYAPGLFEPEGFSEQNKHGYLLGSISTVSRKKNELFVQFITGAKREFLTFRINANRQIAFDEVKSRIEKAILQYGSQNFYEVILIGEASDSLYTHKEKLLEIPEVVKMEDRLMHEDTLNQMKEEHGEDELGSFISALQIDQDSDLFKKALRYGIEALLETQNTKEE